MNQIIKQKSFHESIGMCALCVFLDLVLFLLIMSICFFVPPPSSILGCQALEQRPEAQRELRMCLKGE